MSEQSRQAVIKAIALFTDRQLPDDVDNLRPIEDLGLDSQDGIAVACELSERLGFEIPNEINPLVNDQLKRGRTIKEIIEFMTTLEAKEGHKDGKPKK